MFTTLENLFKMFSSMKDSDGSNFMDSLSIFKNSKKNQTNLYNKAKNSIAFFPTIISSSVSSEPISPLLKALERQFAVYIKLAIQQEDIVDLSNTESKRDFLKSLGFGVDRKLLSLMEYTETTITDLDQKQKILLESLIESQKLNLELYKLIKTNKSLVESYLDKNVFNILTEAKKQTVLNKEDNEKLNAMMGELRNFYSGRSQQNTGNRISDFDQEIFDKAQKIFNDRNASPEQIKDAYSAIRGMYAKINKPSYDAMYSDENSKKIQTTQSGAGSTITDTDIKKYSELPPTVLDVVIYYKSGNTIEQTMLSLGIKAVSHIFDYEDVIFNICKGLKESNTLLRFLKWKTGEIKFWKDFILNTDNLKEDAILSTKKNYGDIWFRLKYLKNKDFISKIINKGFTPTTVLVVSISDVEEIKRRSGINLWSYTDIKRLFDSFFIISFVIIDEASKVVYIHNGDDLSYMKVDYQYLHQEKDENAVKSLLGILTR